LSIEQGERVGGSLAGLSSIAQLRTLRLTGCAIEGDVAELAALSLLHEVHLLDCIQLQGQLAALAPLKDLTLVTLQGCPQVGRSRAALSHVKVLGRMGAPATQNHPARKVMAEQSSRTEPVCEASPSPSGPAEGYGGGCYCGEALVLMADGSFREARDVQAGDLVAAADGGKVLVEGRLLQAAGPKTLVQLPLSMGGSTGGSVVPLLISLPHRIRLEGKWLKPAEAPGAVRTVKSVELHNFVTQPIGTPLIVNGIVVSSLGGWCEGAHSALKPLHRLWGSPRIVSLFQGHPTWPSLRLEVREIRLPPRRPIRRVCSCTDRPRVGL
jgi:hypothetical protein